MIRKAAEFAREVHKGALRKGSKIPYIYHPMEVALLVSQMTSDEDVIAAAYLHDVLEDTPTTEAELETRFGSRITELVKAETEDKALSWHERKGNTVRHLQTASREVRILTLADKLSNLRSTARDYLVMGDQVWERFHEKNKESHKWYVQGIVEGLRDLASEPYYQELCCLFDFVFGS